MKISNYRKRITLLFLGIVISLIALWILLFETSKFPESAASYSRFPAHSALPHTQEFVSISFKLTEHVLKIKISI